MRYLEILREFQDTEAVERAEADHGIADKEPDESPTKLKVFYHVTTKNRIRSIQATGIEPGRKRRWKTGTGRQLGERGKIYLISDFSAAVKWANKIQWERFNGKEPDPSPYVIICLREDPKTLEPDPHPENAVYGKTWFQKSGTVDPENIIKIIPLTRSLIKSISESIKSVTR